MAKITIARAMLLRKRMAEEIVRLQADVQTYNSVYEGQIREVDIPRSLERLRNVQKGLSNLKYEIMKATLPIYGKILEIAEIKDYMNTMRGISTKRGKFNEGGGYGSPKVELVYDVILEKKVIDQGLRDSQKKLDDLQLQVTEYDNQNSIEVDDLGLL